MNMFVEALGWMADPSNWQGNSGILHRIVEHLLLCASLVAAALAVAVPVGLFVGHTGRYSSAVTSVAGGARAIPTLGLLTILGLAFGIGIKAPWIALFVLAVPSVLAGAYSGVQNIERVTTEAARSMGYSEWQIVARVELPLALPVIVGAVRTATLQVIATATLAAYIADVGIGRLLYVGLKTRDYPQMLAASLLVVALSLIIDAVLWIVQKYTVSLAQPVASETSIQA